MPPNNNDITDAAKTALKKAGIAAAKSGDSFVEAALKTEQLVAGMSAVYNVSVLTTRGFKMAIEGAGKLTTSVRNLRASWAANVGVSESAALATIGAARAMQLTVKALSAVTDEHVKQSKALPKVNTAYKTLMTSALRYNKVQQDAAVIAQRYGQSVEEVQQVMTQLQSSIRLDSGTEVGRRNLARMTQEVLALNAAMGVDGSESVGLYSKLIFGMGKAHDDASKNVIAMYSVVSKFNEENKGGELWYDDFTKGVMGAAESTNALSVDMGALSNVFVTAFEKSENLVTSYNRQLDVANAFGKLVTGGPEWLKIKTGESLLTQALGDPAEFAKLSANLDAGIQKELNMVMEGYKDGSIHRVEAAEALDQALGGTQQGIIARLREMQKVIGDSGAGASILKEQLGIEDITVAIAMNKMIQSGDLEAAAAEFQSMNEDTMSFTEALRDSGPIFSRMQHAAGAISTHLKAIPVIGAGLERVLEGFASIFSNSQFLLAIGGLVGAQHLVTIFRTFYLAAQFLGTAIIAGATVFGYLAEQMNKAGGLIGGLKFALIDAFNAVFGRLIQGSALRVLETSGTTAESRMLMSGPTGVAGGGKQAPAFDPKTGKKIVGAPAGAMKGAMGGSMLIRGLLMSFISMTFFQAMAKKPSTAEIGESSKEAAQTSAFAKFASTLGTIVSIMLPILLMTGIEKALMGGGALQMLKGVGPMVAKMMGGTKATALEGGATMLEAADTTETAMTMMKGGAAVGGAEATGGATVATIGGMGFTAGALAIIAAAIAAIAILTAVYFKFKDNTVVWMAAMMGLLGPIAMLHASFTYLYNGVSFLWEEFSRLVDPLKELWAAISPILSVIAPLVKGFIILANLPLVALGLGIYALYKAVSFVVNGFYKFIKFFVQVGIGSQIKAIKTLTSAVKWLVERIQPLLDVFGRLWGATKKLLFAFVPLFKLAALLVALTPLGPLLLALYVAFRAFSPIIKKFFAIISKLVGSRVMESIENFTMMVDILDSKITSFVGGIDAMVSSIESFVERINAFVEMIPGFGGGTSESEKESLAAAAAGVGNQAAANTALSVRGANPRKQTAAKPGPSGKRVNASVGNDGSLTIPFNIANFANVFAELATYTGD